MQGHQESSLSFERIVFFSDAVFAIAITLLVLEIKPPHIEELSESALAHGLVKLIPKFTGFVVSFLIVGAMWIEHHRIFRYLKNYDGGLLWRNLVHLLTISFIPFPTALFSEYFWSRTAFILYTASFGAAGLTKFWVWRYATAKRDFAGVGGELVIKRVSRRSLAVPLACCTAILLSLISVLAAPVGFALIPVYARLLDPTRRIADTQPAQEESPTT
ncbi:MAG TPA: TMEM175 family protein [Blastocatellia bacterium]|nr:TMEM175 family protein [Blastocatellia bacterium]